MTESPGAWEFGRQVVLRPGRAAQALRVKDALPAALSIFLAYLLVSAVFHAWKPFDFPPLPGGAAMEPPAGGLLFWIGAQAWQIPLSALGILLTAWFVRLLAGPGLPRRIAAAAACALLPLVLIGACRLARMPRWIFASCLLALLAALAPGLRRVGRDVWRPLAAWLLAVNAVALASLPVAAGLVLLRAAPAYEAFQYAAAFWMLALATYGVGRIFSVGTARAFCAVFLSVVCEVLCLLSFHILGLVTKPTLAVLLLTL